MRRNQIVRTGIISFNRRARSFHGHLRFQILNRRDIKGQTKA